MDCEESTCSTVDIVPCEVMLGACRSETGSAWEVEIRVMPSVMAQPHPALYLRTRHHTYSSRIHTASSKISTCIPGESTHRQIWEECPVSTQWVCDNVAFSQVAQTAVQRGLNPAHRSPAPAPRPSHTAPSAPAPAYTAMTCPKSSTQPSPLAYGLSSTPARSSASSQGKMYVHLVRMHLSL